MATITEDDVSFETAKLLKDKGFDTAVRSYYQKIDDDITCHIEDFRNWNVHDMWYSMPTLQMAMKWLREVHKIHIIAEPCLGEGNEPNLSFNRWFWTIFKEEGEYKPIRKIDEFSTYEQTVEAAIKYCLENLI